MSLREKIEGFMTWDPDSTETGVMTHVYGTSSGKYLERSEVLAAVEEHESSETIRANNYEQSSQEYAQRAEELAAKLDRVEEFARELERKGKECRGMATDPNRLDTRDNRARLRDKASTYETEARSLRAILEST